jgi:hypothetical protein
LGWAKSLQNISCTWLPAWIGNPARIAERHYLQVPDSVYGRAVQKEARQIPAMVRTKAQENLSQGPENADFAFSAVPIGSQK